MTSTELAEDGSVVLQTLAAPGRGLAEAVTRRRAATALCVATLAALLHAWAIVPRIDYQAVAASKLERAGPEAGETTAHQREEAVQTARKLGQIAGWGGAALGPTVLALAAAAFLFVGFRVAGTRPAFRETFAATAHGLLPSFLAPLLAIPAVLARGVIPPDEASRVLPSSLAALVPRAAPPLVAALSAVDLFSIWSLVLVALGMARASGASRRRAFAVTIVLFVSYVALLKVVPAALFGGGHGPPGPRGGP
jgi:hypothetical protein